MITAIVDNNLWIKLLSTKSTNLKLILDNLTSKNLIITTSPQIENDLVQELSSKIPTSLAQSFIKTFFPFFQIQSPQENKLPFPPPLPQYLDLCLYLNPDYLVPQNYQQFKSLDGYHKINVLESDNFFKILQNNLSTF